MPTIEAYGDQHRDAFAGAYLDQSLGGIVVTLWTRSIPDHARNLWMELWDVVPATPVQFRLVRHTLSDLEHLQQRIGADIGSWQQEGIGITAILLDQVNNELEVGVTELTERAERELKNAYGTDWIRVTEIESGTAP
jgi:hypothetical protein